jgi:endonuclease/exonuclease/phosphatase family metal-dependent hydrolase
MRLLLVLIPLLIIASWLPVKGTDHSTHSSQGCSFIQEPKNSLKVLTLNIGAIAPFGKLTQPQTVERVEQLCELFKTSDYDVLLLQEVWTVGYRKRLKRCGFPFVAHDEGKIGLIEKLRMGIDMPANLKWIARMARLFLPKNYGFDKGLMTLSRYPLKDIKILNLEENGIVERAFEDGEFPVNKGALRITLSHPLLGDIKIVNTHLVSLYPDYSYDDQRANQIREIVGFAEVSHRQSVILGGDFNMSPPGPMGAERLNGADLLWRRLRDTLLNDFDQANLNYSDLTTYPNRQDPNGPSEGVLDHLFVKGDLIPVQAGVVFKEKIHCGKEKCFPADHFGLETIFALKSISYK